MLADICRCSVYMKIKLRGRVANIISLVSRPSLLLHDMGNNRSAAEMPGASRIREERSTGSAGSQLPLERLREIEGLVDRIQHTTRQLRAQSAFSADSLSGLDPSLRRNSAGVPQPSKDQPAVDTATWTALQDDVAQLNELLSRPMSGMTSPINNPSPSEQLARETQDAEASVSIPEQIAFDPMLDVMASPPHIDWSYIDEVINNMQDPGHHQHEDDA